MKDTYKHSLSLSNTLFLFFGSWALLALFLTWGSFFYKEIFLLFGITYAITLWILYKKRILKIIPPTKPHQNIFIASILFALVLTSFFQSSTLFTGRDQGALSTAAIELSRHHSLTFSTPTSEEFFQTYGAGKALNYPGFFYTDAGTLTPHFPLAYIAWSASFYSMFGIFGFVLANAILLFLFCIALYELSLFFFTSKWSRILLFLTLTSFPVFWFSRLTLSENFAIAFLWIMMLSLMQFFKKQDTFALGMFLLSGTLLTFARIEGIILFGIGGFLLLWSTPTRILLKKNIRTLLPLGIAFLGAYLLNFLINESFFRTMGKVILGKSGSEEAANAFVQELAYELWYFIEVYWIYGLLLGFLFGIFGILFVFVRRKKIKNSFQLLIPFIITAPTFMYVIHPFISSDHPWMLRRFMFAVVPVLLLYAVYLASTLRARYTVAKISLGHGIIALLFLAQIPAFVYFFPYRPDDTLLEETQEIAQVFQKKDLVLVEQGASGDKWTMLPGPLRTLFDRQAVYFFNPEDITEIDTEKFATIYLVTAKNAPDHLLKNDFYYLELVETQRFTHQILRALPWEKAVAYPHKYNFSHDIFIYKLHPYDSKK